MYVKQTVKDRNQDLDISYAVGYLVDSDIRLVLFYTSRISTHVMPIRCIVRRVMRERIQACNSVWMKNSVQWTVELVVSRHLNSRCN